MWSASLLAVLLGIIGGVRASEATFPAENVSSALGTGERERPDPSTTSSAAPPAGSRARMADDEADPAELTLAANASAVFMQQLAALLGGNTSRIVGGQPTRIKRYPHQVAWLFGSDDSRQLRCGASILSDEWIISAAHCFPRHAADRNLSSFRVGSSAASKGGRLHRPVSFHQHPDFDPETMDWDMGLVRVEPRIAMGGKVAAIALVDPGVRIKAKEKLIVTGWGATDEQLKGQDISYGLRRVDVHLVNHQRCEAAYSELHESLKVTESMVCAAARHKDSCKGDSGGPLMIARAGLRLLGIVSWGVGCARHGYPGVYTDLRHPSHRQFIAEVTGLDLTVTGDEAHVTEGKDNKSPSS